MSGKSISAPLLMRLVCEVKHDLAIAFSQFPKVVAGIESDMARCETVGEQCSVFIHLLHEMRTAIAAMDRVCVRALMSLGIDPSKNGNDN